jgi:hypothetical protein
MYRLRIAMSISLPFTKLLFGVFPKYYGRRLMMRELKARNISLPPECVVELIDLAKFIAGNPIRGMIMGAKASSLDVTELLRGFAITVEGFVKRGQYERGPVIDILKKHGVRG